MCTLYEMPSATIADWSHFSYLGQIRTDFRILPPPFFFLSFSVSLSPSVFHRIVPSQYFIAYGKLQIVAHFYLLLHKSRSVKTNECWCMVFFLFSFVLPFVGISAALGTCVLRTLRSPYNSVLQHYIPQSEEKQAYPKK